MYCKAPITTIAVALSLMAFHSRAEEHSLEALKHASEAAQSPDSRSIGGHAEEALQHIEAAKQEQANKLDPHLEQGEKELKDAVKHSNWHNTPSAASDAASGKTHLEAIGK